MEVIDPGHKYKLNTLDGEIDVILQFVKRDNPKESYPGNIGHYPGTNIQEVIRVLIDRLKYLNSQIPCEGNLLTMDYLRSALILLEMRAAERHGRKLHLNEIIEEMEYCVICGHVDHHCIKMG